MTGRDECDECELDGLRRLLVARDLIDLGLWLDADPVVCVDGALRALTLARRCLLSAGYGVEQ